MGCGVKPTGTGTRRDPHVHFAWETRDPQGTRRDPQGPAISIFLGKNRTRRDPTRVPPSPTRVHPGPIFLGPGPTPRLGLGSKSLIHSDVGPMHGLFDHGPVFSDCSPDHFPNGVGNCLWHGSPLSAKRTQDCVDSSHRATVGTTASCRSHRNVTDTGRLQATRTSRDYCDKKSCRCFSTRGGRGGGWGWRQASARLAPE